MAFALLAPNLGLCSSVSVDADGPGGNGKDNGAADAFRVVLNGGNLEVYIDGALSQSESLAGTTTLTIEGSSDDDTLTVDLAGGNPVPAGGLIFHGRSQSTEDTLRLTGGTAAVSYAFTDLQDGTVEVDGRVITYTGLEPVIDLVPGTLTVNGTNGDNAITYTQGVITPATNGLVSVDGFETIEFSNKTSLTINGQNGDDEIVLQNPNTPTGLTGITVNGGGGAGDRVVVKATAGTDVILATPTGVDAATVVGAAPVPVNLSSIEGIRIDGKGGDDLLTLQGTAGDDTVVLETGTGIDAGRFLLNLLLPVSFSDIGANAQIVLDAAGGTDLFDYRATDSRDQFQCAPTTGVLVVSNGSGVRVGVQPIGVEELKLTGLGGGDLFSINAPQPYGRIILDGGDPAGGDVLQVMGEDGVNDTFDAIPGLMPGDGTVILGGLVIDYLNVEEIDCFGSPIDMDSITIQDDTGDNTWIVDAGTLLYGGRVRIDDHSPIQFTSIAFVTLENGRIAFGGVDTFRVFPTSLPTAFARMDIIGDDFDLLQLVGSPGNDQFVVGEGTSFTNGTTVNFVGCAEVQALGNGGNDRFEITPATTSIIVDGGSPSVGPTGDTLDLVSSGATITHYPGLWFGEGAFESDAPATMLVQYKDIESALVDGGPIPTPVTPTPNSDPTATASASPTSGTAPLSVSFNGGGSDPDSDPLSFSWDFGDGSSSNIEDPTHTFSAPGTYVVTLTVSDGNGGTDSASVTITVNSLLYQVQKARVRLNFAKAFKDRIILLGSLRLPDGFNPSGTSVELDFGGVRAGGILGQNGKVFGADFKFALKVLGGSDALFKATLRRGNFAAELADEGLTNETADGKVVEVIVGLTIGSQVYAGTANGVWKARAGRGGKMR